MFFQNKQKEPGDKTKKRSVLGFLFNPQIGREIAPLKESAAMFVRMIALIFASFNLFPKDHPAFNDASIRLTTMGVIRTAFQGLTFTREGAPQVAVFVAVTGCLLFSALFVLTLILSLFIGPAQADDIFISPVKEKDWAIQWIDFLFQGKTMVSSFNEQLVPPEGNMLQIALADALSFYSTAVLALAGFLLLYHLIFMVAEAAQSGKPMGRANQIWAPIRLVFAIGMLVPVGTGGDGGSVVGYNTGQYVSMQIGRWGSGLASNVWQRFLDRLNAEASIGKCKDTTGKAPSCIGVGPDSSDIVRAMIMADACAFFVQHEVAKFDGAAKGFIGYKSGNIQRLATVPDATKPGPHFLSLVHSRPDHYGTDISLKDFCGGFEVPKPVEGPYAAVYTAQASKFKEFFTHPTNFVNTYAPHSLKDVVVDAAEREKALEEASQRIGRYVHAFNGIMTKAAMDGLNTAETAMKADKSYNLGGDYYFEDGWLMAGAWFNQIASIMAVRSASVRHGMPQMIDPSLGGPVKDNNVRGVIKTVQASYYDFLGFVNQAFAKAELDIYNNLYDGGIPSETIQLHPIHYSKQSWLETSSADNIIVVVMRLIDEFGIYNRWWDEGGLALQFGATLNPMAELAAFGQNAVETGMTLMAYGAVLWAAGSAVDGLADKLKIIPGAGTMATKVAGVLGAAASKIGSLLIAMAGIFFLMGFTVGFIVPLYPFYRFFFGALQWLMSVAMAVVLAPLFALAHVNPYGEGLAGQNAKYGYSVLMQILLRPALMVFGLIVGLLLFTAAIHFMNGAFMVATQSTGAYTGGTNVVAKILYSIVYCAFVLILANQCFSTIGAFPQAVLSYLGMTGIKEENIGDRELLAAGGAYVGKTILMDKLPAVAKAPGDMVAARKELNDKKDAGELAKQRHIESSRAHGYKSVEDT
jgi:conjugal transfer/type IV secretion protein DotA/TraY